MYCDLRAQVLSHVCVVESDFRDRQPEHVQQVCRQSEPGRQGQVGRTTTVSTSSLSTLWRNVAFFVGVPAWGGPGAGESTEAQLRAECKVHRRKRGSALGLRACPPPTHASREVSHAVAADVVATGTLCYTGAVVAAAAYCTRPHLPHPVQNVAQAQQSPFSKHNGP
jgi:hypothetical protein